MSQETFTRPSPAADDRSAHPEAQYPPSHLATGEPRGGQFRSSHKPVLIDLYCCAGGAARGYQDAGFYVIGVDLHRQPNYCGDQFVQADALEFLRDNVLSYAIRPDAIHASPPCQDYSTLKGFTDGQYPRLIAPTRELLREAGLPYVIENVEGARHDLIDPTRLCGSSFGLRVWRHRYFETSFPVWMVPPCSHSQHPKPIDVTGTGGPSNKPRIDPGGGLSRKPKNLEDARDAMGIGWMTRPELAEAIPPAMTEWLGQHLLAHVRQGEVAA